MIQEKAIIADQVEISKNVFKLSLLSETISKEAVPGQFVTLRTSTKLVPLLRRPFSIHNANKETGIIEILYKVIGQGTKKLSNKSKGEKISVLGPLGKGFSTNLKDKTTAFIVGGGIGIAPLFFLYKEIKDKFKNIYIFTGACTGGDVLCVENFQNLKNPVIVSTDDGSLGDKGFITDSFKNLTDKMDKETLKKSVVYSCGPHPMLKTVAKISGEKGIDCEVSMESFMACGIGACKGCAIETVDGYKMVCKDGPVFNSKELLWK